MPKQLGNLDAVANLGADEKEKSMRGAIFAAVMVGSALLPWVHVLGNQASVYDLLSQSDPEKILRGLPWQGWVVLGGLAAAAIVVVQNLFGRRSALTMILAGSAPWVIIGIAVMNLQQTLKDMGVPAASGDEFSRAFDIAGQFFGVGVYVYVAAATALLLAGLLQLVRRG